MSKSQQSPDEVVGEPVRCSWLQDGPRFALVSWAASTLALALAGTGVLLFFSIVAVASAALAGERSSDRFGEVAQKAINTQGGTWAVLIVTQFTLLCCVYFACRLQRKSIRARAGLDPTGLSLRQGSILLTATAVPFGLGLAAATLATGIFGATFEGDLGLQRMWSEGSRGTSVVWIVLIALLPGFVEELFYRGFLQRGLLMRWGGLSSILTSSLLFAAVHGDPVTAIAIFPLGIWLGTVAWRTNSIRMTFLMHAMVNGLWTGLMMVVARGVVTEALQNWIIFAAFAFGLLAFPWAIQILRIWPMAEYVPSSPLGQEPRKFNVIRSPFVRRLAGGAIIGAAAFLLLIPSPESPIPTTDATTRVAPTMGDLEASIVDTVFSGGFGNDYAVEFDLKLQAGTKILLPSNRVGIDNVIVLLDADAETVWLAYNGEVTGKNARGRPVGIVEQLTSGDPTLLHMRISPDALSANIRLTIEQTEHRKSELFEQAWSSNGWAIRGRK